MSTVDVPRGANGHSPAHAASGLSSIAMPASSFEDLPSILEPSSTNKVRNQERPINKLAVEVLQNIMILSTICMDGTDWASFNESSLGMSPRGDKMRRVVASVCWWWRHVALDCPRLWSSLGDEPKEAPDFHEEWRYQCLHRYVELCVERARGFPLDVYILYGIEKVEHDAQQKPILTHKPPIRQPLIERASCVLQALKRYDPVVQNLAVRVSMAILVDVIFPQLPQFAAATSIYINVVDVELGGIVADLGRRPLQFVSLERLAIDNCRMLEEELQVLLNSLPNLAFLRLQSYSDTSASLANLNPILVPSLRTLDLDLEETRLTPSLFVAQNLVDLAIQYGWLKTARFDPLLNRHAWWKAEIEGWSERLRLGLGPYFPALRRVRFWSMDVNIDGGFKDLICKIVRNHPQLEIVELEDVNSDVDDLVQMFANTANGEVVFEVPPALKHLIINWDKELIDPDSESAEPQRGLRLLGRHGAQPWVWHTVVMKLLLSSKTLQITLASALYPSREFWSALLGVYGGRLRLRDKGDSVLD